MGAYGSEGECSSSDCDDFIYAGNTAWSDGERQNPGTERGRDGYRGTDNPGGQGFIMGQWDDPTTYINTCQIVIFLDLSRFPAAASLTWKASLLQIHGTTAAGTATTN